MRRILGRTVVGFGMTAFVAFVLGCMSLTFGGRTQVVSPPAKENEAVVDGMQRGKAFANSAEEISVYYPIPYASPPNLEFEDDGKRHIQIVDQKADHFRVKNMHSGTELAWKARGILVTTAKASAPSGVVQTGLASPQAP